MAAFPEIRAPDRRIRVGVLLDSMVLRTWEYVMLERISRSTYAKLTTVCFTENPASQPGSADGRDGSPGLLTMLLRPVYRALEAKIRCDNDALAARDATAFLSEIPSIAAAPSSDAPVDLWLQLGRPQVGDPVHAAARYGVWSLRHAPYDRADTGFWPVYYEWPVVESILVADVHDGQMVLARSWTGTNRFSAKLQCQRAPLENVVDGPEKVRATARARPPGDVWQGLPGSRFRLRNESNRTAPRLRAISAATSGAVRTISCFAASISTAGCCWCMPVKNPQHP